MLYVFEGLDNSASVVLDSTGLSQEQINRSIQVEMLPNKDENGLMSVLKCKKSTGEVWYDYIDIPKEKIEIDIEALQAENAELKQAVLDLTELVLGV